MGGPTMSLWIVNDTPEALVVDQISESHMTQWAFTDIQPRTCKCVDVGFEEGWFHWESSDKGMVVYKGIGGSSFEINAAWNPEPELSVNWENVDSKKVIAFPPANQEGDLCSLGWCTGGTMVLLVQDKASRTNEQLKRLCHLPSPKVKRSNAIRKRISFWWQGGKTSRVADASTKPTRDRTLMPHGMWEKTWMEQYADVIGKLSLTKLTIPCSHESGTYSSLSPFSQSHEKTQNLSLAKQLQYGIRVLNLEIGQYEPGKYIISHGVFRTQYTLEGAFKEITDFVDETSHEVIVLDICKFNVLKFKELGFDYGTLKVQMKKILEPYSLSKPQSGSLELQELWKIDHPRRLIVAWGGPQPDPYMWPPVSHHRYNSVKTAKELHDAIGADLSKNIQEKGLWSISVLEPPDFNHTPLENAEDISPGIDNWFYGCGDWAMKANIISSDFFAQLNHTVVASVCANLIKGHGSLNLQKLNTVISMVNEEDDEVDGDWLLVGKTKPTAVNGSNWVQWLKF